MKNVFKTEVTSDTIKKDVLTYFFDRINNYEYRYLMLKTLDDFKKNEKNSKMSMVKKENNLLL